MTNKIAKTFKIIAIIMLIILFCAVTAMVGSGGSLFSFLPSGSAIIAWLMGMLFSALICLPIYAIGEALQLLQDIKDNTDNPALYIEKTSKEASAPNAVKKQNDSLPSI